MRKNHDVENSRGAFEGGRSAYEKLIKRIALKAWILSFVWGALVGLSVNLIVAAVAFMLGGGLYWLGLIAALVFTALFTVIFHRYRFNPTSQKIARVIDDLGLEERMITMEELKNDTSFIAKAQREDAMKTVNGVKAELLAITVPIAAIIAVSSVFIPSASMSVLSVLAANDVISGGSEIIEEIVKPEPVMVEVSYEWDGGGVIEGELFQVVEKGEDCTPVFAVADDEWVFVGWSEKGEPWSPTAADKKGGADPYRQDVGVMEDLTIVAHFMKAEAGDDFDPDGGGDAEADDADDKPPEEVQSQSDQGDPDEYEEGGTGGGRYIGHNQVIDGQTFYGGDTYRAAYEDAMESLNESDMPDDRKRLVSDYYDLIEK